MAKKRKQPTTSSSPAEDVDGISEIEVYFDLTFKGRSTPQRIAKYCARWGCTLEHRPENPAPYRYNIDVGEEDLGFSPQWQVTLKYLGKVDELDEDSVVCMVIDYLERQYYPRLLEELLDRVEFEAVAAWDCHRGEPEILVSSQGLRELNKYLASAHEHYEDESLAGRAPPDGYWPPPDEDD